MNPVKERQTTHDFNFEISMETISSRDIKLNRDDQRISKLVEITPI